MPSDKQRPFESLLRKAGINVDRYPNEEPAVNAIEVAIDNVRDAASRVEHIKDESLSFWSVDRLRDRMCSLEQDLRRALSELTEEETRGHDVVNHTLLSQTFWLKLGRRHESNLAEQYELISQELDRRKVT